jgi:hypothetical protein
MLYCPWLERISATQEKLQHRPGRAQRDEEELAFSSLCSRPEYKWTSTARSTVEESSPEFLYDFGPACRWGFQDVFGITFRKETYRFVLLSRGGGGGRGRTRGLEARASGGMGSSLIVPGFASPSFSWLSSSINAPDI